MNEKSEMKLPSRLDFSGEVFEGLEEPEARFQGKEFHNCTFRSCDFREASFEECRFEDCEFHLSDLTLMRPARSSFREVKFVESRLTGVDWTQADTTLGLRIAFDRSLLDGSSFMELDLKGIQVVECKAVGVNFGGASLKRANFRGTDLEEGRFKDADLTEADLSEASNVGIDPMQSRLRETKLSLDGVLRAAALLGIVIVDFESR